MALLQRKTVEAQRRTLRDLRSRGLISDHAFHAVEEELDILKLTADERVRPTEAQVPSDGPVPTLHGTPAPPVTNDVIAATDG